MSLAGKQLETPIQSLSRKLTHLFACLFEASASLYWHRNFMATS